MDPYFLAQIELSAANLYLRLADRANAEGRPDLAKRLRHFANQERAQAQRLIPDLYTGKVGTAGPDSKYICAKKSQPDSAYYSREAMADGWYRWANLKNRSPLIEAYLGDRWDQDSLDNILRKLGSAEMLIALYYLVTGDIKSFCEEFAHARANGLTLRHIIRGLWLAIVSGVIWGQRQ